MNDTDQHIDEFCSYFLREIKEISHLEVTHTDSNTEPSAGSGLLYRKVLYVTLLDTLAGIRFHRRAYPELSRQNRSRFVRFVTEHCSWPEAELVSLPFLLNKLKVQKLEILALGQYVSGRIAQHSSLDGGLLIASQIDETAATLLGHAVSEKEESAIMEYRHIALLYRYRNQLVHESRQPGQAMEISTEHSIPYYHSYLGENGWYLAYPLAMFEQLLHSAVTSFRAYLTSNTIDPYSLLDDARYW